MLGALCLVAAVPASAHAAQTVVSLTFDDGRATAYPARAILSSHGMHGTFYLNSGPIGNDSYNMTWQQVADSASDGNEIGGHTVDHVDLTTLSTDQAIHEVCDDRATLQAHGYNPVSFAYPDIAYNASVQNIVRNCGYTSGRAGDASYPPAESLPPVDPYGIRTVPAIETKTTLAQMQGYVTSVENSGGGWVVFMFHSVCSNCGTTYPITSANLTALLDWLAPRSANGTTVKTVGEVMGAGSGPDTTPPSSSIACNGGACGNWYAAPVTVSLSASDFGSGVSGIRYTSDGSDPALTGTTYTSPFGLSSTSTVRWYATDVAGNVEASRSKTVGIDTGVPHGVAARARRRRDRDARQRPGHRVGVRRRLGRRPRAVLRRRGTDTTAPYGITWSAKKRGTYTLQAVAAAGRTASSATRTVTVR